MGATGSKLDKALADCPDDERYYGLENFGNTCYCNSVLQALYFCRPFRERLLSYWSSLPKDHDENLLNCLADLFNQVSSSPCACTHIQLTHAYHRLTYVQIQASKKKTGVIPPRKFVQRLKKDNELFRSYMHQVGQCKHA